MAENTTEFSKRERILLAAEEVFSRQGYVQAKVDDIMTLADVGKGTIYNYFGNKEQLFYHLIEERHHKLLDKLHAVDKKKSFLEKFSEMLYIWVNFLEDNIVLWQVLVFEMTGSNKGYFAFRNGDKWEFHTSWGDLPTKEEQDILVRYYSILNEEVKIFEELLCEGQKEKVIDKDINIHPCSRDLFFGVMMRVFHLRKFNKTITQKEYAELVVKNFLYGIAAK